MDCFYRNGKNKSIARQYSELDDNAKTIVNEEDSKDLYVDEQDITDNNPNSVEMIQTNETTEDNEISQNGKRKNQLKGLNMRSTEENPWDNCSDSDLDSLEPFHHTPYQYGDILDDGKVFVWKGRNVEKELFFKSYSKSKLFMNKKRELDLSVNDIAKMTGLPKTRINNVLYYPYIKCTDMLVEQFERRYETI